MRLFLLVLQVAINCSAHVALETVVDEYDHNVRKKGTLGNDSVVHALRLFIPLDNEQVTKFNDELALLIAPAQVSEIVRGGHGSSKRRRIDEPVEDVPRYAEPVTTKADLTELITLYFMGTKNVFVQTYTSNDEDDVHIAPPVFTDTGAHGTLVDLLGASRQFDDDAFQSRCRANKVLQMQREYTTYVHFDTGTHTLVFFPKEVLRDNGCLRYFRSDMMFSRATDIFDYCLPQFQATEAQLRKKIDDIRSSRGSTNDMSEVEMELLVTSSDTQGVHTDPAAYAPILGKPDASGCVHQGVYERMMKDAYFAVDALKTQTLLRKECLRKVPNETEAVHIIDHVCKSVRSMLTPLEVAGVPPVYNELMAESEQHLSKMLDTSDATDMRTTMARKLFQCPPVHAQMTGFGSMMTRTLIGSSLFLGLVDQQCGVFLFLYSGHFGSTFNRMGDSPHIILVGPPSTGKSFAVDQFNQSIASACGMNVNAGSKLAMTVYTPVNDLRCTSTDEAQQAHGDNKVAAATDIGTKLKQSCLSTGALTYQSKVYNPTTHGFELVVQNVVHRGFYVSGTNFVHHIPDAIISRSLVFPVPDMTQTTPTNGYQSRVAGVAIRVSEAFQLKMTAWTSVLQTWSSRQVAYTAMHAAGVIPDMDDTLYGVFTFMLVHTFGEGVIGRRRLASLRKQAEAMQVLNLVTAWWSRGAHSLTTGSFTDEVTFYAANAYMTGEVIVAAYALMDQTSSADTLKLVICRLIKENVRINHDTNMAIVRDSDYYVTKYTKMEALLKYIVTRLQSEGEGSPTKIFNDLEAKGITDDNVPYFSSEGNVVCVSRRWMTTVRTNVELAILAVLRRFVHDKNDCAPDFDNETTRYVFNSSVSLSLVNHVERHPELTSYTTAQVRHGLAYLREDTNMLRQNTFSNPDYANMATYVTSPIPLSVISELVPGKHKVSTEVFGALVVHRTLLEEDEKVRESNMDKFFQNYLSVCSENNKGKRFFAGVEAAPKETSRADHTITVPADLKFAVTFGNQHYAPPDVEGLMWGADADSMKSEMGRDSGVKLQDAVYPPASKTITFSDTSNLEDLVAAHTCLKIGMSESYNDVYMNLIRKV